MRDYNLKKKAREEKEARAREIIQKRQYDIMTFAPSYNIRTNDNLNYIVQNDLPISMVDPKYSIGFRRLVRTAKMSPSEIRDDRLFPNEKWRKYPKYPAIQVSDYFRVRAYNRKIALLSHVLSYSIDLEESGSKSRYKNLYIEDAAIETFPDLFYNNISFSHYGERWVDITSIVKKHYEADYDTNHPIGTKSFYLFSNRGRIAKRRLRSYEHGIETYGTLLLFDTGPKKGKQGVPRVLQPTRNRRVHLSMWSLMKDFFPSEYMMMIRRPFLNFQEYDGEFWLPIPGTNNMFWSSNKRRTISLASLQKEYEVGVITELAPGSRLQMENKRVRHLSFSRKLFSKPGAMNDALSLLDIAEGIINGDIEIETKDEHSLPESQRMSSSFTVYDEYSKERTFHKSILDINKVYGIPVQVIKKLLKKEIITHNGYSVFYSENSSKIL